MPEISLPDGRITWESILYTVALLVTLAGVLAALVKGWEAYRKISLRDRVRRLEGEIAEIRGRLHVGDLRLDLQSDDMGQILSSLQALLLHFISGNDHERLRGQLTGLNQYVNTRTTRHNQILAEAAPEHEENA